MSGRDSMQSSLWSRTRPGSVRLAVCSDCERFTCAPGWRASPSPRDRPRVRPPVSSAPVVSSRFRFFLDAETAKTRVYSNLKSFFHKQSRFRPDVHDFSGYFGGQTATFRCVASHYTIGYFPPTRPGCPSPAEATMDRLQDIDPLETREWVDSLDAVLEIEGPDRAHFLLEQLVDKARRSGAYLPYRAQTAYINTIPPHLEEVMPGDHALEPRLRSYVPGNG